MSEEEQLKAAMELSLQDAAVAFGRSFGSEQTAQTKPCVQVQKATRSRTRKDPQDILLAPARGSAKKKKCETQEHPGSEVILKESEVTELFRLIFGDSPEIPDIQRWLRVGFQFSQKPTTEWGIWQKHGGPCGVYAPVQAFIVKQLLFADGGENEASDRSLADKRQASPLAALNSEDEETRTSVLAHALASILFNSTDQSSYVVCRLAIQETSGSSADDAITSAATAISAHCCGGALSIHCNRFSRILAARQVFEEGVDGWLAGPCGVLSFVCSVLLTRLVSKIKEDMDDVSTPLIGRFGHCSQELVNLMLIGEATSNVFDGTRWLGDDPSTGLLVKGVDSDRVGVPVIGFLSELEPMRYLAVGSLYKYPEFPIWVLGSPTHYTLIFSTCRADSQLSEEASLEQQAKKIFVDNSIDEGGLAMASQLNVMLEAMGINQSKFAEAQREIVREDVILWEDFRIWTSRQFNLPVATTSQASTKLSLFLYDGQDPPGPTLRSIKIELSDIDPRVAGGGLDSDAFVATMQTRWPNAVVQVETLI